MALVAVIATFLFPCFVVTVFYVLCLWSMFIRGSCGIGRFCSSHELPPQMTALVRRHWCDRNSKFCLIYCLGKIMFGRKTTLPWASFIPGNEMNACANPSPCKSYKDWFLRKAYGREERARPPVEPRLNPHSAFTHHHIVTVHVVLYPQASSGPAAQSFQVPVHRCQHHCSKSKQPLDPPSRAEAVNRSQARATLKVPTACKHKVWRGKEIAAVPEKAHFFVRRVDSQLHFAMRPPCQRSLFAV